MVDQVIRRAPTGGDLSDPNGTSGTGITNISGNGHTVYYNASA